MVPKVISLFNHKGGVSKTTTTFNLGWAIVQKGYRVLLVDGDPQSNLTSLALSLPDEEAFEQLYKRTGSNDIVRLVQRASKSGHIDISKGDDVARIIPTTLDDLFILPGNLEIEEFSNQITIALQLGSSPMFSPMANIPGFLSHSLRTIADYHNIDYILIDMAPSLSGLNEVLLMGSDFFITPCSPDFFSEIALKNLARIIPAWHEQMRAYREDNNNLSIPIRYAPKFIGIIQQNYRPRKKSENDDASRPATAFQKWIDRVRVAANESLVPKLREKGLAISKDFFSHVVTDMPPYDISLVSDFNSLIAISQIKNKPVYELDDDDLKEFAKVYGAALDTMSANVKKFGLVFADIAEKIIRLTE
jgi:cellulose biosynthesis protein BcsQ